MKPEPLSTTHAASEEIGAELKTFKFQLLMTPSEAEAIDDWGFANRISSRAEAMRRLCKMALATQEDNRDG